MTTPILSSVLGSQSFYTDSYIEECITLTKSIIVKNHQEAKLYNEYIALVNPDYIIDPDVRNWRYYKHLTATYHELDTPIEITSVDNGATIVLTKTNLTIHKRTRLEILKFGLYYDEIIQRYPTQQLFIKAVVSDPLYTDINQIINLPDYTILSYNSAYIEPNEHDLIVRLQRRVDNYKSIWLIPYYQNLDNLFLASQYNIFYQFLFTSLLSIRLENAKTMRAHSFHIRLYIASNYKLDKQMPFLTRRQQLYLYRNLKYLSNHSGKNHVFRSLINELFNEHNVSVVNYEYSQQNTLTPDNYVDYVFKQKLLNDKNLVHQKLDYDLDYIESKETLLAPSNRKEYEFNKKLIDKKLKNSLFSSLLTKDLETILIDETDSVQNKLLDTVTDYWAYLVKNNLVDFLTDVTDPHTNKTVKLNARDLFKFYVLTLYTSQGVSIDTFPLYRIKKVFNPVKPARQQLEGYFFDMRFEYKARLSEIIDVIPSYRYLMTGYEFSEFISDIYKVNIGLWHMLSNLSDAHSEGQFAKVLDVITIYEDFVFDEETVEEFISRVGVADPRKYSRDVAGEYTFDVMDAAFDRRLSYLRRLENLQKALADVFFNFNSYTVQLVNNYYNTSPILAGIKDRRYTHTFNVKTQTGNGGGGVDPDPDNPDPDNPDPDPEGPTKPPSWFDLASSDTFLSSQILNETPTGKETTLDNLELEFLGEDYYTVNSEVSIDILTQYNVYPHIVSNTNVQFNRPNVFDCNASIHSQTQVEVNSKVDFGHIGTKLKSYIQLWFDIQIYSTTRYKAYMHKLATFNVDITPVNNPKVKDSSTVAHSRSQVQFFADTELTYTGTKLSSNAEIWMGTHIHYKGLYKTRVEKITPINIQVTPTVVLESPMQYSDPNLLFLALNPN